MKYKLYYINLVVYSIISFWTIFMISIVVLFVYQNYSYADTLAKNEAITSVKKDIAYRSWVASHGGVYVPVTGKTSPNPYMEHVPSRDIVSTTHQKYTLMNPSQSLAKIMKNYSELHGVKGHITSTRDCEITKK